jgi:PAS domain S-box-containing protein
MLDFVRRLSARLLTKLLPEALRPLSPEERARMDAEMRREIAERTRTEKALEYERYLVRILMDNLPDRIYLKDRDGCFLRNNRAHLRRVGLTDPAEVLGKTDYDFFPIEFAQKTHRDEQRVIATEQPLHIEESVTWPDGRVDWALVTKMPLRDEAGKIIGTFGISRDITNRKQVEAELQRSREELELRVRQRTEELEQANAALKESLHEKDTLLKEIHHRVKNNLQLISSLLQLQSSFIKDPQAVKAFRECQTRMRSMSLIHEKLYQATSLARIDFAEYVRGLANMLTRTYRTSTQVQVDLRLQPVSLNLETAIPLGLILNELVSNSLKHAFPSQPTGAIQISLEQASDGLLSLTVRDDGVGLPPDFNWDAHASLGLRLIRILVEQIHGDVEILRSQNQGLGHTVTAREIKNKDKTEFYARK